MPEILNFVPDMPTCLQLSSVGRWGENITTVFNSVSDIIKDLPCYN